MNSGSRRFRLLRVVIGVSLLAGTFTLVGAVRGVYATNPDITVKKLSWDVIGLDSNNTVLASRTGTLYVEKLISQNRNSVTSITSSACTSTTCTFGLNQTYTITLWSKSAPNGYPQSEPFLDLPASLLQVQSVKTYFSIPSGYSTAGMYGDLQGLDKAETAKQYGDDQVKIWRRSYDIAPPNGESLKDTAARALPYFNEKILPDVKAGNNVLVSAHGNSLRAIVMALDNLTREQVLELNIPNGVPIIYDIDSDGKVVSKEQLD